jgi:CHAD domain-containing protein
VSTASVRDVCADILDDLAEASLRQGQVQPERASRLRSGAETLRWVEGYEYGQSAEAMREEIQALREQVGDLQDEVFGAAVETARADRAEAELVKANKMIDELAKS